MKSDKRKAVTGSTRGSQRKVNIGIGTMSRIGKKPILLPKEVNFKIESGFVFVKGPKGELKMKVNPSIEILNEGEKVFLKPARDASEVSARATPKLASARRALWGLYHSLVANMIKGVVSGFEKSLTFQGVGFKAIVKENDLELSLGFTNPIVVKAPEGISFKVEKNKITVSGIDRELVGQVAAEIRKQRKTEPYQGSGIKYADEIIIRKAGKKAAAAAS